MRKLTIGIVFAALVLATFLSQSVLSAGTAVVKPPPKPHAPPNPVYINTMSAAALYHISQADGFLAQASDLLGKAKEGGKDVATCEKLIGEGKELVDMAKSSLNPIYANDLALKALQKLAEAIECLKG